MKIKMFLLIAALVAVAATAHGQERPPANVVVGKVTTGSVAPSTDFVGTVYFSEKSDVAAEVSGKAVEVAVKDGDAVKKGDVLVRLNSDILSAQIANARAVLSQARAQSEQARLEKDRHTRLFKAKSVSEGEYDEKRLTHSSAEASMAAAQAKLSELRLELEKTTIRAPYDGLVVDTPVDRGEWVSTGQTVATVVRDEEYDVVVNLPQRAFGAVETGLEVTVKAIGGEYAGKVYAVVPKGDVASRTFPVKIRVRGRMNLAEGMEVRVSLPSGTANKTLIVPRDAVISSRGKLVVVAVVEGKAQPIPVRVIGFRGMEAGVEGEGLQAGMTVVVKGNERLQPGQPVNPVENEN